MAQRLGGRQQCACFGLTLLLGIVGCGDGSGDDDDGESPGDVSTGQITDAWRPYCVATFTSDYEATDTFGDSLFLARRGEEYLMADYGDFIGKDHAELLYLTPKGPASFEIEATAGSRAFPFTTSCAFDDTLPYYAAFLDVAVYTTEALTTKLCDLPSGSVLPRNTGAPSGYATSNFDFSGPATYELQLNAFSAQCGGAATGYISVPMTRVFDTNTWLVPVIAIVGPK